MNERVLITDIAWPDDSIERSILESAGFDVVLADSSDEARLAELAADAVGILTCFAQVTRSVIDAASRLRVVGRTGVGLDNIDIERCAERGIEVTRVPDYCVDEVATHTVALALSLWRRLPAYGLRAQTGGWGSDPDGAPLRRLAGRRVAVLGRGRIGSVVARRWAGFDVEVVDAHHGADIVCLHLPLTDATKQLVDDAFLADLAPGAILVNTGRGGLIDDDALLRALDAGVLSGAALDVFRQEPLPGDSPLLGRSDLLLTPHMAFYSGEALEELRTRATTNILPALGR